MGRRFKEMMLREVCDAVGVSRRAVQGYESAGLVSASGRNSRGYLLYDEAAQEKIRKIKLFQEMGFSIKEIKVLLNAPNHVLKAALEVRVEELGKENGRLQEMIVVAREMISRL